MHITNNVHSDKIGIENIKCIYIPIFFFWRFKKHSGMFQLFFIELL